MLHPNHTRVALAVDMFEDILVIHLTRRRFLTSRIITGLEVRHFTPRHVDVGDDIPLRDLLVIHVKGNLARRTTYCFADLVRLRNALQEQPGMISRVQGLQDHGQAVGFEDGRGLLEVPEAT